MSDNTTVKVSVRVRPLVQSETSKGCRDILDVYRDLNQVKVKDSERAFTFNHVFPSNTTHEEFYNTCVKNMIKNLFEGYNVTILAYGQTGSGKTYSMGTTYTGEGELAVIPRAVNDIFAFVKDNFSYDFTITVSFMELYQEVLYDLLANRSRDQCIVEIREDKGIIIPGLTERPVKSAQETLECLIKGSRGRAVGSTNMNAQSSRSHAIFTISICMQKKDDSNFNKTAKFHLVDLAGSERSKKTGATGQTFKEGVNINKGLLALGNVISALGDEKLQQGYISYRDSNLTRLLKDSLGGNSITLMIACISPADYNLDETVSTLRYADRARKIRNKPIVNEDPKMAEINRLNKLVQQLRLELVGQGGPIICQAELELIRKEANDYKLRIRDLTHKLSLTLNEKTLLLERVLIMQSANERLQSKLIELRDDYNVTLNNFNMSLDSGDVNAIKEHVSKLQVIQQHFTELDSEQKKNVEELKQHEETCVTPLVGRSSGDFLSETEINERHESHTNQQIKLNIELQEITKILVQKEHLIEQISANTCHFVDLPAIEESKSKIASLEKEKEELLKELKTVKGTEPTSKVAEMRRKRVQELEHQLHDLNRKVQEQARMIKLKEKDELKIKNLHSEIQLMKQTKVKLIKSMRQESEKFRSWKLQKERDLSKLREQGRKRENEFHKMKSMHTRQQNVLKRKVEEAAAINKRLKDALALRKTVQDQKYSGKLERIGQWLHQEFEIFVSTVDAEATLAVLLEDRGTLHKQLDQFKEDPEMEGSSDIKQLEDDIELRSTQIADLQQKILDSDEENKAKTRWDNIQTMAEAKYALKTLFDLTAENRKKEAANEGKISELQSLLQEVSRKAEDYDFKIQCIEDRQRQELSDLCKEYEEKVGVLLRQLRGMEVKNKDEEEYKRTAILQEANEKLDQQLEKLTEENKMLLTQNKDMNKRLLEIAEATNKIDLRTPQTLRKLKLTPLQTHRDLTVKLEPQTEEMEDGDQFEEQPDLTVKLEPQTEEMEDADESEEQPQMEICEKIEFLQMENEQLKRKLAQLLGTENAEEDPHTPIRKPKIPKPKAVLILKDQVADVDTSIEDDDPEQDPDWRKTPLARKLQRIRNSSLNVTERMSIKRSSDGGCTCKTACSTKVCGCRKMNRGCNHSCKCKDDMCKNRGTENQENNTTSIINEESEDASLSSTTDKDESNIFDKPTSRPKRVKKRLVQL